VLPVTGGQEGNVLLDMDVGVAFKAADEKFQHSANNCSWGNCEYLGWLHIRWATRI